ncbi:MAG TPA: molybdenum ABC transporter ATP-binding protein [Rhizomicrobium sp.]|jgi:molybdate transport system ATP-binding protein
MSVAVSLKHDFGSFALDVAFEARDACVTALFGPSGAGKTSVINAIAGLIRPDFGRIAIGDRVVFDSRAHIFVPPRRRRVGYVFQDARLFPHLTVAENLLFGWRRAAKRASPQAMGEVWAMLGLDHIKTRYPAALSGGEKSRVALGRALLASPEILLLDEPLAALDTARRNEILPYLERLRDEAKLPMVYVSHAFDEVARLAHEIVVLRNGRVVRQGSVFDMATAEEARGLFGAAPLGALFDAVVETRRDGEGLCILSFAGGRLRISNFAHEAGTKVRVRVRAEDIMLAAEEPRALSANNILAVTVTGIHDADDANADIQISCNGVHMMARITRASTQRLGLGSGQDIFAIIKSVTIDL